MAGTEFGGQRIRAALFVTSPTGSVLGSETFRQFFTAGPGVAHVQPEFVYRQRGQLPSLALLVWPLAETTKVKNRNTGQQLQPNEEPAWQDYASSGVR